MPREVERFTNYLLAPKGGRHTNGLHQDLFLTQCGLMGPSFCVAYSKIKTQGRI